MIVHSEPLFVIIFGDKRTGFVPRNYHGLINSQETLNEAPFVQCKKWGIESLSILHQTHSTQGLYIDTHKKAEHLKPFTHEADFSLTQLIGVGLAVVSADCLPIILYDKKNHAIANVHAGWRGSVDGIASIAFERMINSFGSEPENMRIFFGPSAKRCCYSVGTDVQDKVGNFSFKDEVLQQIGDLVMFDLPLFNKLQLESLGIAKDAFNDAYNICTIHTESFNSYRRTQSPERQSTIVALR
ncbi:peptidoglycan editing factor PgeF [Candidatus Dependentiae bacterium]|nr:peptidoglycan editing factor PgeF [Candidatus Dependentiae bacterium]